MNDQFFQKFLTNLHIMKKLFPHCHLAKETGPCRARFLVLEKKLTGTGSFYKSYPAINIQHTVNKNLTHISQLLTHISQLLTHMLHKHAF